MRSIRALELRDTLATAKTTATTMHMHTTHVFVRDDRTYVYTFFFGFIFVSFVYVFVFHLKYLTRRCCNDAAAHVRISRLGFAHICTYSMDLWVYAANNAPIIMFIHTL